MSSYARVVLLIVTHSEHGENHALKYKPYCGLLFNFSKHKI